MLEAIAPRNQQVNDETTITLEAARRLGVSVLCSASLLLSRLLNQLPDALCDQFGSLSTDVLRCLRLTPGVTPALTGISDRRHMVDNLATARVERLTLEQFRTLLTKR